MRSEDSKILAGNKNKAVALLRNAGFNIPGPVAYATDLTKMILSQSYTISQEQKVNNTEEHGERILDGEYRIIQNDVPAKYVYANGDSIHEYGYDDGADYEH